MHDHSPRSPVGEAQDLFKYSRLEVVLRAREKHTQGTNAGRTVR